MNIMKLDGQLFKTLVLKGAENLKMNYQYIDSLNVFPVPDGDTGTNMRMTIENGVSEIASLDETNIYEVSKKLSRGMLMGARGNSGVILSQLFRGMSKGLEGLSSVTSIGLAKAFKKGVEQAYKAVMTPVEGTILTVAREASEKMCLIANSKMSINEFLDEYILEAKASLDRTPDLLPALKEAGVVDSGGAGYICIIEGMIKLLNGESLSKDFRVSSSVAHEQRLTATEEVEFGYCTEFILQLTKVENVEEFNENVIYSEIEKIGNSIVLVKDEDIVKVHIHTLTPGEVFNIAQKYGEFLKIKVENMTIQHNELQEVQHVEEGQCECGEVHHKKPTKPAERSKYAVVSVATGAGLVQTFKDMGVDYVVSGGQSMNPSTEDFINGFDTLNADNIIVFPNNKNIVLAAKQAAKIYKESKVWVIETKTISQGFSALTMLDLSGEPEDIISEMKEVISNVISGSITYSIRDVVIEGLSVHKDDFMGILDGKIVSSNKKRMDAFKGLLKAKDLSDKDVITVIYGSGVNQKEINEVTKYIEKNYSNLEVNVIEGNQEVYSYILAIE